MPWMRIRLELARTREFPEGSHQHGYEFVMPLDARGKLDRELHSKAPELCTVHRFWSGEQDLTGNLHHAAGGRWMFSYHLGEMEDEPIPRLEGHIFREGEYLGIRERDGREYTFRIVVVTPAPGVAKQPDRTAGRPRP